MKNCSTLTTIMCLALMCMSCEKESSCEMNNTGRVVIHNTTNNSKLWLTVDKAFGPGLSSAEIEISAGDSAIIDRPAGIHNLYGVFTTPLGNNGTQMSSADDKEFVLGKCDETNVYYAR